ncbi:MAG: FKBP-type peptidyl-prolyl cis-trans isomerase [Planctomycetota bacterium]|nr:FKBP-type peptidyl-prolyl cis-trans isomerase [Planctomycetota bacterium]
MRIYTLALTIAIAFFVSTVAQAQNEQKASQPASGDQTPRPEMSAKQKASYGIGQNIGRSIKQQGLAADDLDPTTVARGIFDALSGKDSILNEEELAAAFAELQRMIQAKSDAAAGKNVEAGRKFLADNSKKPGVKTTKTGLQYEVIRAGNGATPTKADTVTTHYKGQLINGDVFDGSYKGKAPTPADEPISFPVGGVIAGWTEALQLMKVGDKWRLFIPSELAYGERGAGRDIGPNSTLIFEIELIGIK